MKSLIVCCDGTWNRPDQEDDGVLAPTNVRKLFNMLQLNEANQKALYQSGVGTGGLLDSIGGGLVGMGISENIRDCYKWLATHYEPGDKIYLFGFSRGAFTVRSLAGMIGLCGLLNLHLSDGSHEELVKRAYEEGYRERKPQFEWGSGLVFHATNDEGDIPISFIGVWDTVGALGVPDDKILLNMLDMPSRYHFHDVTLGKNVECACHAVAMDEVRGSFSPTLWSEDGADGRLKQVWFPGVHSDVGGGFKETGLSDGALLWMVEEAKNCQLKFVNAALEQLKPDPFGTLHNSYTGFMKVLISAPRNFPNIDAISNQDDFHSSVMVRKERPCIEQGCYLPTYRPTDGEVEIDIHAEELWNWTGIYLEAGKSYEFSAEGEWLDSSITSGPDGTNDGKFHFGEIAHIVGNALGFLETGLKKLLGKEQLDIINTKRVEEVDWFCLTGAVADGGNPDIGGTHDRLTYFKIGESTLYTPATSGYLYCFANDAWGYYFNNRGFVTMTVKVAE